MSNLILPRRSFLTGIAAAIAAPAIVRVESLMKLPAPVRKITRAIRLGDFVSFADGLPIGIVVAVADAPIGCAVTHTEIDLITAMGGIIKVRHDPAFTYRNFGNLEDWV